MSGIVFQLKERPEQRLDLSALTPHRLDDLSLREIEALDIATTRTSVTVGDLFRIKGGDPATIRISGSDDRCDRIGWALSQGEIVVDGDAGAYIGGGMSGGRIVLRGSAGIGAGAAMAGGQLEIAGDVEERAGGPVVGETFGMRGGRLVIKGNAGPMLGERMRRGLIVVGGDAGDYAGARVIAGTLILQGRVGRLAGYGMRRGSLILNQKPKDLLPTFGDCGVLDFDYLALLERGLRQSGIRVSLGDRARRYMGDMAVLGKGEMLVLA